MPSLNDLARKQRRPILIERAKFLISAFVPARAACASVVGHNLLAIDPEAAGIIRLGRKGVAAFRRDLDGACPNASVDAVFQ